MGKVRYLIHLTEKLINQSSSSYSTSSIFPNLQQEMVHLYLSVSIFSSTEWYFEVKPLVVCGTLVSWPESDEVKFHTQLLVKCHCWMLELCTYAVCLLINPIKLVFECLVNLAIWPFGQSVSRTKNGPFWKEPLNEAFHFLPGFIFFTLGRCFSVDPANFANVHIINSSLSWFHLADAKGHLEPKHYYITWVKWKIWINCVLTGQRRQPHIKQ